jgi:hypothetical protein
MTREAKRTVQDSRRDLRMLKYFDAMLFRRHVADEQAATTREALRAELRRLNLDVLAGVAR